MTELAFAKQFLATLDKRAIKLPSDYVADPRKLSPQTAAYILPKMSKPMSSPSTATKSAPGSEPRLKLVLKPTSAGKETISMEDVEPSTGIYDVKVYAAEKYGYEVGKVKILKDRRPVPESKSIKELLPTGAEIELSVMLMGQPTKAAVGTTGETVAARSPDPAVAEPIKESAELDREAMTMQADAPGSEAAAMEQKDAEMPDAPQTNGNGVAQTQEFWDDLKGYLVQRLRDEGEGDKMVGLFRAAWESR